MSIRLTGTSSPRALNRLAREQLRLKILADIHVDLMVCELEGWDATEWIHDLHTDIGALCPCAKASPARRAPLPGQEPLL